MQLYSSRYIGLAPEAKISANSIFMYSGNTIEIEEEAVIESTVQHECTTDNTGNTDLFMCIPTDYDETSLDQARLLDYFNRQYDLMPSDSGYASKPTDMHSKIMNKWNVYLIALGDIIGS